MKLEIEKNPAPQLGFCQYYLIEAGENFEHIRLAGDRARIAAELAVLAENPSFRLEYHEPLSRVFNAYSVRLTVHLVPVVVQ